MNQFRFNSLSGIFILIVCICYFSACQVAETAKQSVLMQKAVPVWAEGREKEMNLNLGFHGVFQAEAGENCLLKLTASSLYRVFLNGEFLGYGPARSAHAYFRVDEYDLTSHLKPGNNVIAIEVAGYNVNSFYTLDQSSFLQAELLKQGKVALATGSGNDFTAFQMPERLQKVERYSFQRPFTEYYRMNVQTSLWKTSVEVPANSLKLEVLPAVNLLPRNILMPEFDIVHPVRIQSSGIVRTQKPETYKKDRSRVNIGEKLKGYKEDELEVSPSQFIQELVNQSQDTTSRKYTSSVISLSENEFTTFDLGTDLSGFIGSHIRCEQPTKVVFYFDEILTDGDVNTKKRMADVNNQVVYELEPGDYHLETFESYTFKYLKVIVLEGKCDLHDVYLREYAYPENHLAAFNCSNEKLNAIYRAARQTYRQNAVDIFMDCPSRERAGWLCDSYFSAIQEKDFTGKSAVAHNFYENYALPDTFACLPSGMLPMCYPADHYDKVFIPNWALWFIIQIDDYAQRGGDPDLVARLKPRIEKLLAYFAKFENEDGLLEKLDSWIFVEWSKANGFVRDVNYPTNMLYSAAIARAGKLYHNQEWIDKAKAIKETVLKQSFNGKFFVDNAVRSADGKLQVTNNTTEVCQYYAFFFDIATPETHPELWQKIKSEFGPNRDEKLVYPEVFRANAFIGNYLRMDILSRYNQQKQLQTEIQDYFYGMARQTGTLWENMGAYASCDHGFASYLGHVLYRDILGIKQIDYIKKDVLIQFADVDLEKCSGAIPVDDSAVELSWERTGKQIRYSLKVPEGYTFRIENLSSSELVKMN